MAQSQLSKDIKKLNERLADFERHGAERSEQYQSLINKLQTLSKDGLELTTTKSGHTAIKNSVKYGEALQERLGKLAQGKNTYGRAKKQAIKQLKQQKMSQDDYNPFVDDDEVYTDDDINDILAIEYEVHDNITNYAEAIYYLEQKGEIELHGNNGKLDVDTMKKINEVATYSNRKRGQMARRYKESKEKAKKAKTTNYLNKQKENEAKSKGISLKELDELNNIMSELSIFSDYVPTEQEIIRAIRYGTVEELKRKNRDGVF